MYKKIDLNKLIVYDIETLINCFIVCCRDFRTGSKKSFVIFNDKEYDNQPFELFKFIRNAVRADYTFVGFNSLAFDSQIIHSFYDWSSERKDPLYELGSEFIIDTVYKQAQELISLPDNEKFKVLVPEHKLFAPQIDLFKQLHYDRPAKATSLKWIQFSMRYPTVQDMPIDHDEIITKDQVAEVLEYCWNDVDATFEFFTKVKFETEVRLGMSHEYKLNLINASEPKMVRDIFSTFLTKEMDITYQDLKQMKTIRKDIAFKDIIFPYVKFRTKEFQEVLDVFRAKVIDANPHSTDKFKHTFNFRGMEVELGLGGIHACAPSGVYTRKEGEKFEDADGTSFYPFLAIQNNLYPEHLPTFNKVYPMMYEERKKYGKKDPKNYIFKIILNSAYGLSKEINGYLYDPKFTYSVTINGQLSLLMLVEALNMSVPDIEFVQMNTDGITYIYKEEHEPIVRKICKWWEETTKINLEYAYYEKMVIRDVNNYMAVDTKGGVKKKGIFETEMQYHKNPSSLIVPKALEQYFVNSLTPDSFIRNPKNSIFDYCNGVKKKSNFKLNLIQYFGDAEFIAEQQKVTRYIISTKNDLTGLLVKDFKDGRRIAVEANKIVMPLNTIDINKLEVENYTVDFADYIKETQRIIETIEPSVKQQKLF